MGSYRYSELDWLRVVLIFAVFLHHVFMPFNGDGWHVMNKESSKVLDDIMVYFEQLRLQTLFFIAGAGSFILLNKVSGKTFLTSKFHRLFVPLIVGMVLIVPPQIYFEEIDNYSGILDAYSKLALSFNANHLWFIEFLIVFMLLAVPLNKLLKTQFANLAAHKLARLAEKPSGLFSLVLIVIIVRLTLKYVMPSQSHSIENLSVSIFFLFFFLAGMFFINNASVWLALEKHRATNLKWFVLSSVIFYAYYFKPDISEYVSLSMRWQLWWLVCTLVSWSGLLTLVGYASVLCKESPKWLHSANEIIYPFYILHQSIIVVFAFYIVQWDAGIAVKSISLLLSSLLVCITTIYLLIKPFNVTRYMFGLKIR
ncbi:acyltransferase [Thalassotalea euphylliae]|uniref:Acyltransferase n=1 Tax=Thalassotalea euphylliae TaxID=1655234 RepID=A0A3E0TQS1_9GAMM|nr:acyltransferase family protein [Thalassotalea euphylliae]REL26687.1 acyltransferase [Thalassotalea euphylliae]